MSGVHRYAVATALAALAVLVAGALVNAHHAALAVPDWPLSFGQLILTRWPGNTLYEQSHRVAAAIAGFMIIGLVIWVRRRERLVWVRRLTWTAAGLYLVQVVLGGVVVLAHDPPWVAVLHVALAQAVFTSLAIVAVATSPHGFEHLADGARMGHGIPRAQRRLVSTIAFLVALQIVLGAASRHPPFGETPYVVTLLTHLLNALLLLVLAVRLVVLNARRPLTRPLNALTRGLLLFLLLQWAIGLPLFIIAPEPDGAWPPPEAFPALHAAHVATAALVLACACTLIAGMRRLRSGTGA